MSSCSCATNSCNDNVLVILDIAEDDMLLLQRYAFEKDGLLSVITQFTSDSPWKPDKERYGEILDKFIIAHMSYSICVNEILHKYEHLIRDKVQGIMYKTTFSFITNQLIVEKN